MPYQANPGSACDLNPLLWGRLRAILEDLDVVHQDPHGIPAPLALRQPTRIESETGNSGQIQLPIWVFVVPRRRR